MQKNSNRKAVVSIVSALMLAGCANQQPPSGGPVDTTTPEVVETVPANSSVAVHDSTLSIRFSKYVDQQSVEGALFISPYPGEPEFDWNSKEVDVHLPHRLLDSTTYVVTIGTDVFDLSNKNHLAHSYTLAFSTGTSIDSGSMTGRILQKDEKKLAQGIMVFAYRLDGKKVDTLNPRISRPDFITQTGNAGEFVFLHLPLGRYRIIGVKDEYRNLLYDPEVDEYAVYPVDILLTPKDTSYGHIVMKLAMEDTTSPRLLKAEPRDSYHVTAEFSEPVIEKRAGQFSLAIVDTLSQAPLGLQKIYWDYYKHSQIQAITERQDSTKTYRLIVQGVCDSTGNTINPLANSIMFHGAAKPDTAKLKLLSVSLTDSSTGVVLRPEIVFSFSNEVDHAAAAKAFYLTSLPHDTLPLQLKWMAGDVLLVTPAAVLNNFTWYTLHTELRMLESWNKHACADSTKLWRFQTLDEYDLSSIEGQVMGGDSTAPNRAYVVEASRIDRSRSKYYSTVSDLHGNFLFQGVEEGRYVLQAYIDNNKNMRYDAGNPFPFVPSEPISLFSDTLRVRARWPLEGVKLKFK